MMRYKLFLFFAACLAMTACRQTKEPAKQQAIKFRAIGPIHQFSAKDCPEDSLDYIVAPNAISINVVIRDGRKYHALTEEEMGRAKRMIADYIGSGQYEKDHDVIADDGSKADLPLPFREYFRQYVGYTENGHVKVDVFLASIYSSSTEYIGEMRNQVYIVHDGGNAYANVAIDLTEGKLEYFMLHGYA